MQAERVYKVDLKEKSPGPLEREEIFMQVSRSSEQIRFKRNNIKY